MPKLLTLPILLCALLVSACNNDAINIDRQGTPALWKVTKNIDEAVDGDHASHARLYLFGTIHLLPKGARWQSKILDKAIAASDQLIVETTGLDDSANVNEIFTSMASDEQVTKITNRLDGPEQQRLEYIIDDRGLSKSNLNKLETWAAALAISNSLTNDLGLRRALGVETILHERFKNRTTEGLETIESQFSIFDNLSETDQRTMLKAIINGADQSQTAFLRLLNAWLDGDSDALLNETDSGILSSPNVRAALLDRRNRKWAVALNQRLNDKSAKTYFVAVGAAHLVGPNGLPELLKSDGYSVQRIQ